MAYVTVRLDGTMTDWMERTWDWTFTGGAEGASALLGTVAGSMITIAGVVFSMTLVALSLTSSQFGPRLLRTFMRDTTTHVVLGTFVATFLYCLIVLRTIRHEDEVSFVPHLSVTLGVVFAVGSVGVLIYFIHHVSVSIQANEIVSRVGKELREGIERLFPEHLEQNSGENPARPPDASFLEAFEREARAIKAERDGYLQFVDGEALVSLAVEKDAVVRLERRPGHYVVVGRPLALVWPGDRVDARFAHEVNRAFALDHQRTSSQDLEFAIDQLVEIAVRALSPSLNDPFTAMTCVDRLGSAFCRLAQRDMPSPYLYDGQGRLRVIAPPVTFPAITDAALNQIRQYGRSSAAVTIRLLETIAEIARVAHRPADLAALLRHAEMIVRGAQEGLPEAEDRRQVEERYETVRRFCLAPAASS